jgi:dihydroflavonol-4-reductase
VKALVTGAAGFIGSHVVRALVAAGHQVRALCLPGEPLDNLSGLPIERCAGDVTDRARVAELVRGCDWVFHLAAVYALWLPRPARLHEVNVGGTENVLAAAAEAGVARVVYTSSIARFGGQGPGRRADEQSPFRLGATGDLYSQSKNAAHEVALAWAARGLDVVIAAPTGPLGPGDRGPTPTGRLLRTIARAPVAVVTPTASNFADVRDMALGHLRCAERGRRGESYLLGNEDWRLADLARLALGLLGKRRPVVEVPFPVAAAAAHALTFAADHLTRKPPLFTPAAIRIARLGLTADCLKARRELDLPATPLAIAVHDALAFWGLRPRPVSEIDPSALRSVADGGERMAESGRRRA